MSEKLKVSRLENFISWFSKPKKNPAANNQINLRDWICKNKRGFECYEYPTCHYAEANFLLFLLHLKDKSIKPKVKRVYINNFNEKKLYSPALAIQKTVEFGEKTFLTLNGPLSGLLTYSTYMYLEIYNRSVISSRPLIPAEGLIKKSVSHRKQVELIETISKYNGYINALLYLINELNLPIDEEQFLDNVVYNNCLYDSKEQTPKLHHKP